MSDPHPNKIGHKIILVYEKLNAIQYFNFILFLLLFIVLIKTSTF